MEIQYGGEHKFYGFANFNYMTREEQLFYISLFHSPESTCYNRIFWLGKLRLSIAPVNKNNDGVYANVTINVVVGSYYPGIYADISKEALADFMQCKISLVTLLRDAIHMTAFDHKNIPTERHIVNREEVIAWLDLVRNEHRMG